jgi:hypothetical protein
MTVLVLCGQVIQIILILSKSAQTVILLTCIQQVPGSILAQIQTILSDVSHRFTKSLQANATTIIP